MLRSWFNYRKADPGGRRSSLLDDINPTTWPLEWTGELLDLLSVLTQLVDLHTQQADLLAEILTKPLATRDMLTAAGVSWPTGDRDPQRKPDYTTARTDIDTTDDGQLGFAFN